MTVRNSLPVNPNRNYRLPLGNNCQNPPTLYTFFPHKRPPENHQNLITNFQISTPAQNIPCLNNTYPFTQNQNAQRQNIRPSFTNNASQQNSSNQDFRHSKSYERQQSWLSYSNFETDYLSFHLAVSPGQFKPSHHNIVTNRNSHTPAISPGQFKNPYGASNRTSQIADISQIRRPERLDGLFLASLREPTFVNTEGSSVYNVREAANNLQLALQREQNIRRHRKSQVGDGGGGGNIWSKAEMYKHRRSLSAFPVSNSNPSTVRCWNNG